MRLAQCVWLNASSSMRLAQCVWLSASGSVSISLFAVLGEVEPLVLDILRDTASH